MKIISAALFIALLASSCSDNEPNDEAPVNNELQTEVPAAVIDTLCFLRTGGINDVDSAFIKLIVEKDSVIRGDMRYLPKEKDSRIGVILPGKMHGDTMNLEWNCIQEGRKFSVPVSFILRDGNIYQKLWAYDNEGEEYLPDTASYGLMYKPVDCSLFPVKVY